MKTSHVMSAGGWLLALSLSAPVAASDPIGIYAVVDRVVLEPKEEAPERIQIWGIFCVARGNGEEYAPPARGYLYFSRKEGKEEPTLKEWADLKRLAGSPTCLSLASRHKDKGRIRKASEKPENPDVYPLGYGLTQVSRRDTDYPPIQALLSLPTPRSPGDGGEAAAGAVTLVARNVARKTSQPVKYMFEIQSPSGEKETSPEIAAGEKETRWSPRMTLKAGERYTWRVWTFDGSRQGAPAAVEFRVRPPEKGDKS